MRDYLGQSIETHVHQKSRKISYIFCNECIDKSLLKLKMRAYRTYKVRTLQYPQESPRQWSILFFQMIF